MSNREKAAQIFQGPSVDNKFKNEGMQDQKKIDTILRRSPRTHQQQMSNKQKYQQMRKGIRARQISDYFQQIRNKAMKQDNDLQVVSQEKPVQQEKPFLQEKQVQQKSVQIPVQQQKKQINIKQNDKQIKDREAMRKLDELMKIKTQIKGKSQNPNQIRHDKSILLRKAKRDQRFTKNRETIEPPVPLNKFEIKDDKAVNKIQKFVGQLNDQYKKNKQKEQARQLGILLTKKNDTKPQDNQQIAPVGQNRQDFVQEMKQKVVRKLPIKRLNQLIKQSEKKQQKNQNKDQNVQQKSKSRPKQRSPEQAIKKIAVQPISKPQSKYKQPQKQINSTQLLVYENFSITINKSDNRWWIGFRYKSKSNQYYSKNCVWLQQDQLKLLSKAFNILKPVQASQSQKSTYKIGKSKCSMIKDKYKGKTFYGLRMYTYYDNQRIFTKNGFSLGQNQMEQLIQAVQRFLKGNHGRF